MKCEECARKDSAFCNICEGEDLYITKEDNDELERLCDLICGEVENE